MSTSDIHLKSSPLVGAIDEGTSSARFIIFEAGTTTVVASHQVELTKQFPQEGWVEQDPMVILDAVYTCIKCSVEKLSDLGRSVDEIVAIGVTNQRESTIVWDKTTGVPLHNSIVWLDMRTAQTVDQLLDKVPNKSRNKEYLKPLCGLPMSPYFSACKIRWLQDNVPKVKKAMDEGRCLFGNVDSWLIWNLTGGKNNGIHITDVSNASRTMLMNIDSLKWDPTLINFFEIPKNILPNIKSSSEVYGEVQEGPLKGIPISGCLGDQQSALVGQQCLKSGQAKATYGTGCFLLYNTGNVKVNSTHGLITTVAYQLGPNQPPVYALEGSVAVAGAALSWLRDNMSILPHFGRAQSIAREADLIVGGDVVFVPAFSGLYAPYWQQNARGVICGISAETNSSHIIKAALEAVCFQTRDVLDAMDKDYGRRLQNMQVDGGMTANSLLMQLQADLAGVTVNKPNMAESTALGAAMVAGAAVGCWDIVNTPLEIPFQTWSPRYTENERDVCYVRWKNAVERAMGWDI
ncbi:PREDICTED: glycerol kinase [Nicrophorus vespilloides]|uniref:glycerol kinase n=1 Tax=Nicrophorus vespilloides TaxID=110193 RepID=A0ABM1MAX0_NICVS|nr:PREDICTED: glycerol kinase [Nicrophorus vespilloides]